MPPSRRLLLAAAAIAPLCAQTAMLFPIVENRKMGFIDRSGKVVVPPRYDRVGEFSDGMARVSVGALSGYIDAGGAERIKPAYSIAREFGSGRALVSPDGATNLLIDRDGRTIAVIPYRPMGEFHQGLCRVQRARTTDAEGKTVPTAYGYIGLDGKIAIEPQFINAGDFPDDDGSPAIVIHRGYYLYIDRAGKTLLSMPISAADRADGFHEGLLRWKEEGWWGYRDTRGQWAIPPRFDSAGHFEYGRASVVLKGKSIVIDRKGAETEPPQYALLKPYSEGRAVASGPGGRLGYVDERGRLAMDNLPLLEQAHPFSGGLARVKLDGRFGFIDKTGRFALRPQFSDARDFRGGLAWVLFEGGTMGYIDAAGNKVWESKPLR